MTGSLRQRTRECYHAIIALHIAPAIVLVSALTIAALSLRLPRRHPPNPHPS